MADWHTKHSRQKSIGTVDRYIDEEKSIVEEGVLRISELSTYLDDLKMPRIVALSEDAFRITNRVQYDAKTNRLVGFV